MHKLLFLFFFIPATLSAQNKTVLPDINESYYKYIVSILASDSMKGRLCGTKEEKASAEFILSEMKKTGCKSLKNTFIFPFQYKSPDSVSVILSNGNVIGRINTKSKNSIVISAHYDHIGLGQFHSRVPFSHGIHNGADDNASGVALMLSLSEWCNKNKNKLKYDVIFAAFSGEEDGLYGSESFINSNLLDTSKIICCINFDMVGRMDIQRPMIRIDGALDFNGWNLILPSDSADGFIVQRSKNEIISGADHCTFLDKHIPAILITTGLHSEYHTPNDDIELINFKGLTLLANYIKELLMNLNKNDEYEKNFLRSK